ncbi:minichromosome maintenance protein 5, partial [Entomortierella beljakovae]
ANSISKLIRISGIIIAASPLTSKATILQIRCKSCQKTKKIPIQSGFSGVSMPRTCDLNVDAEANPSGCGLDPYIVDHDKSKCVDQQILKLQESPDDVPVGELPRHVLLSADRELTNRVVPGSRATIMGVYSVFQTKPNKSSSAIAIRTPYIRVVGINTDTDSTGRKRTFTDEEEEEFISMSREPGLYQKFANSIAPSIFGNHVMANIGWDAGRIHTAQVLPPQHDDHEQATMDRVQEMFYAFIQQFHINGVYIYRDQLRQNAMLKRNLLDVDMGHLISYNQELAHTLTQRPSDLLPL